MELKGATINSIYKIIVFQDGADNSLTGAGVVFVASREKDCHISWGTNSISRYHLTSIGKSIVEIRRYYIHNGISYTGKTAFYIESGPRLWTLWQKSTDVFVEITFKASHFGEPKFENFTQIYFFTQNWSGAKSTKNKTFMLWYFNDIKSIWAQWHHLAL